MIKFVTAWRIYALLITVALLFQNHIYYTNGGAEFNRGYKFILYNALNAEWLGLNVHLRAGSPDIATTLTTITGITLIYLAYLFTKKQIN